MAVTVPEALAEAAAPILRDARALGIRDIEIASRDLYPTVPQWPGPMVDLGDGDRAEGVVRRSGELAASGIMIWLRDPLPVRAWQVAETVQEHVIESGDNTFPACPAGSDHPLWLAPPESPASWPVWRCQSGHTIEIELGKLEPRS